MLEPLAEARGAEAIAFDVIDVLGGFASLVKRSATLDGSVPVRVARACVPLLEGNAWGHQIALRDRLTVRRRLGGWTVDGCDDATRLLRASVGMLVADGTLRDGAWRRRLDRGIVDTRGGLSVFTGLFVRPRAGTRLRQSATANRRSYAYRVAEAILDDTDGFTPIVLDLDPDVDSFVVGGEIATLAALPDRVVVRRTSLVDAPRPRDAHLAFYDAAYFDTKKRGATSRKYRDDIARHSKDHGHADAAVSTTIGDAAAVSATIVDAGPASVQPASPALVHRADGPHRVRIAPDRLVVRNAVSFTATFDGQHVVVTPDRRELDAYARGVHETWQPYASPHPGALLYLSKYVTPHPPGEPHFFVKPSTLVETSPGASTVIDGRGGAGFDIMRGVVATDSFHATPAVFHLWQPGATISVGFGEPLADLFPIPRSLIEAGFAQTAGGVAARLS